MFFEGSNNSFLADTLPLFELKKLNISKISFEVSDLIDTLIRYKEKGSYSGMAENNAEVIIKNLIRDCGFLFEKGDLKELFTHESVKKRTMDFILPNKENPQVIIECTFLVTTSSGQGDKSKTEITIKQLISKYYPNAKFIGFVDGIGWYVRQGDLQRMVSAYDDVFTFHPSEIERFRQFLQKEIKQ